MHRAAEGGRDAGPRAQVVGQAFLPPRKQTGMSAPRPRIRFPIFGLWRLQTHTKPEARNLKPETPRTGNSAINPNPIRSTVSFATTSIEALPIYFPQIWFFGARNLPGNNG